MSLKKKIKSVAIALSEKGFQISFANSTETYSGDMLIM
jgi:hypothetical protein